MTHDLKIDTHIRSHVGIGMGNPGVFQGYPYPHPNKPIPAHWGAVFDGYGCRVVAGLQVDEGYGLDYGLISKYE